MVRGKDLQGRLSVNQMQLAFNVALIVSVAIFVGLLGALIWAIRPYKNFERGVATLVWAFPASVLATMLLVYLDTPYIFLSLFGGPGLSALIVPPAGSRIWRILGGVMLALSAFITLVTTGVLEIPGR
jgi:hypothetical protein